MTNPEAGVPVPDDPEKVRLFNRGRERGIDPTNNPEGPAKTTVNSFWAADRDKVCKVCRHTFRVGDQVFVDQDASGARRVRHHSAELPCSGQVTTESAVDQDRAQRFYQAADALNPLKTVGRRLLPGEQLVAKLPLRRKCSCCGHTLRPLEAVVLCPCNIENPRCKLPVHHDPFRGLDCLTDWLLGREPHYCPMSFTKLRPK